MIFSENRYPPRIKCGAGFFGIMLKGRATGPLTVEGSCPTGAANPKFA